MKVRVYIARSVREYANVIVEAESVDAARAYVEEKFANAPDYNRAYCDIANAGTWAQESSCVSDEAVTEAEEHDDQDEEADIVVPGGAHD